MHLVVPNISRGQHDLYGLPDEVAVRYPETSEFRMYMLSCLDFDNYLQLLTSYNYTTIHLNEAISMVLVRAQLQFTTIHINEAILSFLCVRY